jgi:hypothetical protein
MAVVTGFVSATRCKKEKHPSQARRPLGCSRSVDPAALQGGFHVELDELLARNAGALYAF